MELKKSIIINLGMVVFIGLFSGIAYFIYNYENDKKVSLAEATEEIVMEVTNPFYEEKIVSEVKAVILAKNVSSDVDLNNWKWPTERNYTITSYYGYRWGELHNAIDIYNSYDSNVMAANNGIVIEAKGGCVAGYTNCNRGRGNYIVIHHTGSSYYTMYMHLNKILVTKDKVVSGGEVIGTIGNTGNVLPVPTSSNPYGGTHLHFGTFKGNPLSGGNSFNPLTLYKK